MLSPVVYVHKVHPCRRLFKYKRFREMPETDKIRVIFYVDGCNLHQGLRQNSLRKFYWLSLKDFAQSFLSNNQTLVITKYFTARASGDREKHKRHTTYIEALQAHGGVEVIEGRFQNARMKPPGAGGVTRTSSPRKRSRQT